MSPRRSLRPTWSLTLGAAPRGLVPAREKGWFLAWDEAHWLYLLGRRGERQAQRRTPGPLAAATAADDGTAYAAVGVGGELWWLAPDLSTRWEGRVPEPTTAVALDPFGQYLAVATERGGLHVYSRLGQPVCRTHHPRPLVHLAFVPASPVLLGAAEYGLVVCSDLAGRQRWRDGPVAHVGSLAASGDGGKIVLACFSEGLQRYGLDGTKREPLALDEPCRLAALSFDGRVLLAAVLSHRLLLLNEGGKTLATYVPDGPVAALALGALADYATLALADGRVVGLDLVSRAA
jgi:hypothetical protein